MRGPQLEQAEDGLGEVVLHGPGELVADLLLRQLPRHQVLDAVRVFALHRDVQRMHSVAVGGVHVRMRREQKLDQLNVSARERVVERRATTAVLPIVRVGAALDEARRDRQSSLLELFRITVARGHLMKAAVKKSLAAACALETSDVSNILQENWARMSGHCGRQRFSYLQQA